MLAFDVTRNIAAPPERIWELLTDAAELASGRYGILKLEGRIAPGEPLKLWSAVNPGRAFALKVRTFEPPAAMTWSGGLPFGLFTGTRTFVLQPQDGGTRFTMRESFTGPLAGLIGRSIPDLGPSFAQFGDALKTRAEAGRD